MEDWYEINFNKSKNIAYFSCLRGAIELVVGGMKVKNGKEGYNLYDVQASCLEKWEKWYLKEFPRPQDENERSLNKIKNI